METKVCTRCKKRLSLPEFNFCKAKNGKKYPSSMCKKCNSEYRREYSHLKEGVIPFDQNRECAPYLGVHIAEHVLSQCFEDVKKMPYGNPGYDFICKRGFKIDVKSSCKRSMKGRDATYWMFNIQRNRVADHFLCLAFDNRDNLEPLHIWLVPSNEVNMKMVLEVPCSDFGLFKWHAYELPLGKVIRCCDALREH